MDRKELENRFTYHPPKPGQPAQYTRIRDAGRDFAALVDKECPNSRELSLAITKIEEAVVWANSAIARHGEAVPDAPPPDPSTNYGSERVVVEGNGMPRPLETAPRDGTEIALVLRRPHHPPMRMGFSLSGHFTTSDWRCGPDDFHDSDVIGWYPKVGDDGPADISVLVDMLALVSVYALPEEVEAWTVAQRNQAESWAAAVHLDASDNEVEVPPRPDFLPTRELEGDGIWPPTWPPRTPEDAEAREQTDEEEPEPTGPDLLEQMALDGVCPGEEILRLRRIRDQITGVALQERLRESFRNAVGDRGNHELTDALADIAVEVVEDRLGGD